MNEWRSVVTQGATFLVLMELFEIGKWLFTDGVERCTEIPFSLE